MEFKDKLIKLRNNREMKQAQLAEELDVSVQTVYRWENGNFLPNIYQLKKLCQVFSVPAEYFLSDDDVVFEENDGVGTETCVTKSTSKADVEKRKKALAGQMKQVKQKFEKTMVVLVALLIVSSFIVMYFFLYSQLVTIYYQQQGIKFLEGVSLLPVNWWLLIPTVLCVILAAFTVVFLVKSRIKRKRAAENAQSEI